MTKVLDQTARAAGLAIAALALVVSAAEGRDLGGSVRNPVDARLAQTGPMSAGRSVNGPAGPSMNGALQTLAPSHRRRSPRHFNTRVAPRPDCELGLHGCFVRNGDRRGAF